MDMENIVENLVRIGTVSAVDAGKKKARVLFRDKDNLVSGWLYVIQHSDEWMPAVNDTVLVLYLPVFNADGFILGAI